VETTNSFGKLGIALVAWVRASVCAGNRAGVNLFARRPAIRRHLKKTFSLLGFGRKKMMYR
jgi:hypothetical protein